jgi:hypothetical protein
MKDLIRVLADRYTAELKLSMDQRVTEMEQDDRSHILIYEVLGISESEGKLIDVYQNKGRFLYKYAGSFLEEAAKLCFKHKFADSGSVRVPNTRGQRPKTFEIDCVVGSDALEIKWRDATTDGDPYNQRTHTNTGYPRSGIYTGPGDVLLPKPCASGANSTDIGKSVQERSRRVLLWRRRLVLCEAADRF